MSDVCDVGTLKMSGGAAVSNSSSRPELLLIMGSLIDHGWSLAASRSDDVYLFEKAVDIDVLPPPPIDIQTPPLPPPKTPGLGLGRKEAPEPVDEDDDDVDEDKDNDIDLAPRISLTNEQETTNFKQKMIFGIKEF